MRTTCAILALSVVVIGCAGGVPGIPGIADSHEKIQKDQNQWTARITEAIKGIKDRESAIQARPKLVQLIKEREQIDARWKKLPKMTPEQKKEVKDKHFKEAQELAGKYLRAGTHLLLATELKEAREELEKEINLHKMKLK